MNKKVIKYLKIAVAIIIVALLLWFFVIQPLLTFKGYEKQAIDAAKRYYELNERELPTGTRVKTLSVQKLFDQAYLKEDFYIPFSKKPCSVTESWVKVRKEDGEYKYYAYLKCGIISSTVDHRGPDIMLSGEDKITLEVGDKYKEPGVSSVVDNTDGKMDVKDVEIDSSEVDTDHPGTYKVRYTATDSLNNESEVTREVNVIATLKSTVERNTSDGVYQGADVNNYIYFSGNVFRILDIDGDNVRIVAEQDVSNVNYQAIDEWLDYYYDNLADSSKRLIVDNKYCNMKTTDDEISTITKCSKETKSVPVSILSAVDYNNARDENGNSYLYPMSISWIRNSLDSTNAFATRDVFFGVQSTYMSFDKNYNFGVRPVITIKGDTKIVDGDGSIDNPYDIDDFARAEVGDKLNTRQSGEYLTYSGMKWRIIGTESDGTTKVVGDFILSDSNDVQAMTVYETNSTAKIYNPKQRGNVGYFINNRTPEYVDTEYFVNKEIEVPIYKRNIKYGEESNTKKYKVRFSAPNIYDLYTAYDFNSESLGAYWFLNSSKEEYTKAVMAEIGTVMYGYINDNIPYGVRPVGYLDKQVSISNGSGTFDDPYVISK